MLLYCVLMFCFAVFAVEFVLIEWLVVHQSINLSYPRSVFVYECRQVCLKYAISQKFANSWFID